MPINQRTKNECKSSAPTQRVNTGSRRNEKKAGPHQQETPDANAISKKPTIKGNKMEQDVVL